MEESILIATERTPVTKKFKETAFINGVVYGENISEPVKFERSALKKVITKHGFNAKVWVDYNNNKKFGFIKELQRNPITGKVIHIDVQLVSQNQEIRLQIPITFQGVDNLEQKQLMLQIYKAEVDALGKPALMPDLISIDVSNKELGDTITSKDFALNKQIKIKDKETEVYGIINTKKKETVEEPEKAETTDKNETPENTKE